MLWLDACVLLSAYGVHTASQVLATRETSRTSIRGKKLESHEAAVKAHSNAREGEAMFGNNIPC